VATPSTTIPVTTGTDVTAALGPQVELIFADVTSAGTVTAALSLPGSVAAPVNFVLLGGTSSYDITTNAVFTGNVEVCIAYNPAQITAQPPLLELFHYSGSAWTTLPSLVNTSNNTVCGQTSSFSTSQWLNLYTPTRPYLYAMPLCSSRTNRTPWAMCNSALILSHPCRQPKT